MWTAQVILLLTNTIIALIEGIIGLRIFLKLIGASTVAPFVDWVYATSQPLLVPFEGMLPTTTVPGAPARTIIEFSAIFALLVYAFLAYLINELLAFLSYRRSLYVVDDEPEVVEKTVRKKRVVV